MSCPSPRPTQHKPTPPRLRRTPNSERVARELPPKPQPLEEKPKPHNPERGYRGRRARELFARDFDDEGLLRRECDGDLFGRGADDEQLLARAIPGRPPPLVQRPRPHGTRPGYFGRRELEDGLFAGSYGDELD